MMKRGPVKNKNEVGVEVTIEVWADLFENFVENSTSNDLDQGTSHPLPPIAITASNESRLSQAKQMETD